LLDTNYRIIIIKVIQGALSVYLFLILNLTELAIL